MKVKRQKSKVKSGYTLIRTIRKNLVSVYGYTLIEILVALTIIGILFGFGYVSFRDFSRRQVVAGTAKSIQADLRLAQGDAISGQKPAGCTTTLSSYIFEIQSASRYTIEANCAATPPIVKDVTLSSGITFASPFPSPNPLNFKILSQGTNVGIGATWVLTLTQVGTGNVANVTVTSGGEIKGDNVTPGVSTPTPTPGSTPTPTPGSTPTPTPGSITTCTQYCATVGYSTGTCRKNSSACSKNHESYEQGGNIYCTRASADTCCCK